MPNHSADVLDVEAELAVRRCRAPCRAGAASFSRAGSYAAAILRAVEAVLLGRLGDLAAARSPNSFQLIVMVGGLQAERSR